MLKQQLVHKNQMVRYRMHSKWEAKNGRSFVKFDERATELERNLSVFRNDRQSSEQQTTSNDCNHITETDKRQWLIVLSGRFQEWTINPTKNMEHISQSFLLSKLIRGL